MSLKSCSPSKMNFKRLDLVKQNIFFKVKILGDPTSVSIIP